MSLPIVIVGNLTLTWGKGGVGGGGKTAGMSIPHKMRPPRSIPGGQKKQLGPPFMKGYSSM